MAIVAVYLTAMIVASSTSNSAREPTTTTTNTTTVFTASTTMSSTRLLTGNADKPKIVNQLESSIIYVNSNKSNSNNTSKKQNKSTSRLSNKNNMVFPTPFSKYALTTIITDGKKSMIIVYPTGMYVCCL